MNSTRFESEFATAVESAQAVSTADGLAAFRLAFAALGIGFGDDILIPDLANPTLISAILSMGARPIPVDIDDNWTLNVTHIESRITPGTKAMVACCWQGHPPRLDEILLHAREFKLHLIEDATHGFGATHNGRNVGSFGDLACYDLGANDLFAAAGGGMVTTNKKAIARRLHSSARGPGMTKATAATGRARLKTLPETLQQNLAVADRYNRAFAGWKGMRRPPAAAWVEHSYWQYAVEIDEAVFGVKLQLIRQRLLRAGINCPANLTPAHLQPFSKSSKSTDDFSNASLHARQALILPSPCGQTLDEVDLICETFGELRVNSSH